MDGTRFDALAKRLAAGASRRRVLAGLGGALAGAVAQAGGGRAAAGITCEEALRRCLAPILPTWEEADRACRTLLDPEAEFSCVLQARRAAGEAQAACLARLAGCTGTCKLDEEPCRTNEECCSGRCGVVAADPRPVFGCK